MTTDSYAQALYGAIYASLGFANQDSVRYAYGCWLDREITSEGFFSELERAMHWLPTI